MPCASFYFGLIEMLILYVSPDYFFVGCISNRSYILAIAPELPTPQLLSFEFRKLLEHSFCCYRLYQLQYLTGAVLWSSTTEYMYVVPIEPKFIDYNVVPLIDSLHCLSDTFLNLRHQQYFAILDCRHKMISDFIDSMWPLSQFHPDSIIIPQTPFSKGGSRSPHSRDCGVLKI